MKTLKHNLSFYNIARSMWKPMRGSVIHRLIFPRRFHTLCVGTPKSGTHSIANLFNANYRAAHEPDSLDFIRYFLKENHQNSNFNQFLKERDRRLWLEMEASHYLVVVIDKIVKEFPDIKIILTIRDCYSWVNSQINQMLRTPRSPSTEYWFDLRNYYFNNFPAKFHAEEKSLSHLKNVYPLDNLFAFWHQHNSHVLKTVPKERLLILRTNELHTKKTQAQLSSFLEIKPESLLINQRAFSGRAPKYQFDLFSEVEHEFIEATAQRHCTTLMKKFFPEISSINNVLIK